MTCAVMVVQQKMQKKMALVYLENLLIKKVLTEPFLILRQLQIILKKTSQAKRQFLWGIHLVPLFPRALLKSMVLILMPVFFVVLPVRETPLLQSALLRLT